MIKPVAKTYARLLHPWLSKEIHVFYDTTQETSTPDIIREFISYRIQWQNVWASIRNTFTLPSYDNWYLHPQRGAVSFGTVSRNSKYTSAEDGVAHATIASFNITHDATGADILVLGASADANTQTITSTYAGASLTVAKNQGTNRTAAILYKGSPATGSNTCTINYTTANDAGFGVVCTYSGSAGTMSSGVGNTGTSTSTSGAGNTVTSTSGDMAFDVLTIGTAASAITVGAGQTSRAIGADTFWHNIGVSEEASTGVSVTMSWSWTTSSNYAHASANIDQSVASGPTNLKSLDTNVKANIKSYNTNLIANIKSINTNS